MQNFQQEFGAVFEQHVQHLLQARNDPIVLQLLTSIRAASEQFNIEKVVNFATSLEAHVWECMHLVHWKDVEPQYRKVYGLVSWVLARCSAHSKTSSPQDIHSLIDKGILLGSSETIDLLLSLHRYFHDRPQEESSGQLEEASSLSAFISNCTQPRHSCIFRETIPKVIGNDKKSIPTLHEPDLMTFYTNFFLENKPVVLRGCLESWQALERWPDLEYINRLGGHRLVPVEVGRDYLSEDSGQELMTIRDFICKYILACGDSKFLQKRKIEKVSSHGCNEDDLDLVSDSKESKMGYMAQHCLFDQIPELRRDIDVPDYCSFLHPSDEEDESANNVIINAWFGPIGTSSPLHHDPYHNLLAQVHGRKFIRLFDPDQSSLLHPMEAPMSNSSSVDLMSPHLEDKFPELSSSFYNDVILEAGDMLFIPRWHWHYCTTVKSVEAQNLLATKITKNSSMKRISIDARECFNWSVNFWWGKRIIKNA